LPDGRGPQHERPPVVILQLAEVAAAAVVAVEVEVEAEVEVEVGMVERLQVAEQRPLLLRLQPPEVVEALRLPRVRVVERPLLLQQLHDLLRLP